MNSTLLFQATEAVAQTSDLVMSLWGVWSMLFWSTWATIGRRTFQVTIGCHDPIGILCKWIVAGQVGALLVLYGIPAICHLIDWICRTVLNGIRWLWWVVNLPFRQLIKIIAFLTFQVRAMRPVTPAVEFEVIGGTTVVPRSGEPEAVLPGSSFLMGKMAACQVKLGIQVGTEVAFVGCGIRLGEFLITAKHVVGDHQRVLLEGKSGARFQYNLGRAVDVWTDVVAYEIGGKVFGNLGVKNSKIYCDQSASVSITGVDGRQSIGMADLQKGGCVAYKASTTRGFSGAPYMVGNLIYGMHLTSGTSQENYGVSMALVRCMLMHSAKPQQPESTTEWLEKVTRKVRMEVRRSPMEPDEYIVSDGKGDFAVVDAATLDELGEIEGGYFYPKRGFYQSGKAIPTTADPGYDDEAREIGEALQSEKKVETQDFRTEVKAPASMMGAGKEILSMKSSPVSPSSSGPSLSKLTKPSPKSSGRKKPKSPSELGKWKIQLQQAADVTQLKEIMARLTLDMTPSGDRSKLVTDDVAASSSA